LKIAPEGEAGLGIFFVNETGTAVPVTHRVTSNDLKTIIARIPALPAGKYTLRIVTKFSNSSSNLKKISSTEYEKIACSF